MEREQLFLIEFIIEKVNIPIIRAIHEEILPIKTCVSFQILDLPPLNIYQETPTEACACIEKRSQVFNKGKSCLFALPHAIPHKPLNSFPITISVYKELPPGVLPDVMLIGTHQIQAHNLINWLLSQQTLKLDNACKRMKDTFKITTATGQCVGEVTVFIRASCFGKKIVTQFQIPCKKELYLFKGINDGPIFQCKRITPISPSDKKLIKSKIKCACSSKKISDGSGEARRIQCPTISSEHWQKEWLKDLKRDKCAPCCRSTKDIYSRSIFRKKETVRKCGCVIKEKMT